MYFNLLNTFLRLCLPFLSFSEQQEVPVFFMGLCLLSFTYPIFSGALFHSLPSISVQYLKINLIDKAPPRRYQGPSKAHNHLFGGTGRNQHYSIQYARSIFLGYIHTTYSIYELPSPSSLLASPSLLTKSHSWRALVSKA